MKNLTIVSGKGGAGKSSITASLAILFSEQNNILCADCDVDAPNLALVLGVDKWESQKELFTDKRASFNPSKCTGCGKCFDSCAFDSIKMVDGKAKLKGSSCEGCGVCQLVCPEDCITLEDVKSAELSIGNSSFGFKIVSAQLDVGSAGTGKIVNEVKEKSKELAENLDLLLVDSSAGIGCPVISSLNGSDFAVVVTEPTLSGFSDMKRIISVINHFKIPYGIIINKADINQKVCDDIKRFAAEKLLGEIPFNELFVKSVVARKPAVIFDKSLRKLFLPIYDKVARQLNFFK